MGLYIKREAGTWCSPIDALYWCVGFCPSIFPKQLMIQGMMPIALQHRHRRGWLYMMFVLYDLLHSCFHRAEFQLWSPGVDDNNGLIN